MTEEWGRVVEGGEFVKPAQLNGHLCIVYPIGYVPHIQTKFSGQGNKPSDGIAVDVVDLDDKNEQGLPGKVYRNSNFMQSMLIASLKSQIGGKVLGTFGQGVARNGMNPPWILVDMSGDPQARERASAWLQANPNFLPSPFVQRSQVLGDSQQAGTSLNYSGQGQGGGYQQPAQQSQPQQNYTLDSMRATNNAQPANPGYQQPAQQAQPQYTGVQGSPQLSQEDMTVLQQHRAARVIAEAEAQKEALRQAGFQDQPPF
jgi:hypothetical protein